MSIKTKSLICRFTALGILSVSLLLFRFGVEGWAKMGSYNLQGSERFISQTYAEEEPTITILKPAVESSSNKQLRIAPPLGLSDKKRLGVLLLVLGVVAEEES